MLAPAPASGDAPDRPTDTLERVITPPVAGPLTYFGNRAVMTTRTKPTGTIRIAVVGDSFVFGVGTTYRRGFGARLAAHLNGALPEHWVESLTFGVSGACLHHGVARVETHALTTAPDVVILGVCANDAFLLGPQPSSVETLAEHWLAFRPLIRRSLGRLRDAAGRTGSRVLVVYLDRFRQAAHVCIPDELAAACGDTGLPFVDGSSPLAGYSQADIVVSRADGHLNAFANDIVARRVAQALLSYNWLPASGGYSDPAWIEQIVEGLDARVDGGLGPTLAAAEALAVLDMKWLHRRNTGRARFEPQYSAARAAIVERQRTGLLALAPVAMEARLRAAYPLADLSMAELWTNEATAATLGLEHVIEAGESDEVSNHLNHLDEALQAAPITVAEARRRWLDIHERAVSLQQSLQAWRGVANSRDTVSGDFVLVWRSRVSQWCHTVERCAGRCRELLTSVDRAYAPALVRLLGYLDRRAVSIHEKLEAQAKAVDVAAAIDRDAWASAGQTHLMLEIVVSAPCGDAPWTVTVGVDSYAPSFSERQTGTAYFVRDGQPHLYEFDLPQTLIADVHMYIEGDGLQDLGRELHLLKAQVCDARGDGARRALPSAIIEHSTERSVSLVFRGVSPAPATAIAERGATLA